ncbi:MAG: hypothetical protein Q7S51_00555 [Gallionellaceae bacterium]|nr:hypothetical protein [Gallionellaceae bacterium]
MFCLVMQITGCASPAMRMDEQAAGLGYHRQVVKGEGYEHVVYIKPGRATEHSILHVYLEGDGTPWVRKHLAAFDPTPRKPVMLALMALDSMPSLYLGRPCYHGLSQTIGCMPDLWTSARYSEVVVASMTSALTQLAEDYQSVILMGYSGGGTLAMLLAERLPKTKAVITLAANLDTDRWAALHGEQLSGSLNPARRPPLPTHIKQQHFAGGEDDNVPPALIRDAVAPQPGAAFKVFEKFDHGCCWQTVWSEILDGLITDF